MSAVPVYPNTTTTTNHSCHSRKQSHLQSLRSSWRATRQKKSVNQHICICHPKATAPWPRAWNTQLWSFLLSAWLRAVKTKESSTCTGLFGANLSEGQLQEQVALEPSATGHCWHTGLWEAPSKPTDTHLESFLFCSGVNYKQIH